MESSRLEREASIEVILVWAKGTSCVRYSMCTPSDVVAGLLLFLAGGLLDVLGRVPVAGSEAGGRCGESEKLKGTSEEVVVKSEGSVLVVMAMLNEGMVTCDDCNKLKG